MIVDTPAWAALTSVISSASTQSEQLTMAADVLSAHEQVVRATLASPERDVVDSISGNEAELEALQARAPHLADDAEVSEFLVSLVSSLDRIHSRAADIANEGDGETTDHWGPFNDSVGGEAFLLRWPRAARQPSDRQSLLSLAMPNHRVLSSRHGGIQWQLDALGSSASRRAIMKALLSRDSWPLKVVVWPGLDAGPDDFVAVGKCAVADPSGTEAAAIQSDVFDAIKFARRAGAHILVLPELYVPRASLGIISERLADTLEEFPVMTVMGLSHLQEGTSWINEAVVLDYSGVELWRHRKLASFVDGDGLGECLSAGVEMRLRSSPMGWIATLICLDLFASPSRSALLAAAPSLVLAPSLSAKTSAHRNVLDEARAYGVSCAVANRPLGVDRGRAPSVHSLRGAALSVSDPTVIPWTPEL